MSMADGNTAAELRHDQGTGRADAGIHYLAEATDDIVERVMQGKRVPRCLDLQDFLADQLDLPGLVSSALVCRDFEQLNEEIERRLRKHLEGSGLVLERADEMAEEEDS